MKSLMPFLFLCVLSFASYSQNNSFKTALLKYHGGGDWYSNPTSLPNLIKFCNQNLKTNINTNPVTVEAGNNEIFNYPFIHLTGHGNVIFSDQEVRNLRMYMFGGGFLHIDDNYGMDKYIRREIKKIFPEYKLIEIPFSHAVFHQKYEFPNGLPKIHEHDNKAPQAFGIFHNNRMICLYTYECDLGDGWEDREVHNDSETVRLKALKMGANILQYVFTN